MIASLGILTLIGFIPIDDKNFEKIILFLRQNEKILSILYVALEGFVIASILAILFIDMYNQYKIVHWDIVNPKDKIQTDTVVTSVMQIEKQ